MDRLTELLAECETADTTKAIFKTIITSSDFSAELIPSDNKEIYVMQDDVIKIASPETVDYLISKFPDLIISNLTNYEFSETQIRIALGATRNEVIRDLVAELDKNNIPVPMDYRLQHGIR